MTLPDPAVDLAEAERVLELLLAVEAERHRAHALIQQLQSTASAPQRLALSRLRLELGQVAGDDGQVSSLLAGFSQPDEVDQARRLAAAAWLNASKPDAHGVQWIVAALGGRYLVNLWPALARRPALRDALRPALDWLQQAPDPPAPAPAEGPGDVVALLAQADAADRRGDYSEGSRLITEAYERCGEREDIARALVARAELLLEPRLRPGGATPSEDSAALSIAARATLRAPDVEPAAAPRADWNRQLEELLKRAEHNADSELALLESIGSRARAARGWLARGDRLALSQAMRLRDALSPDERTCLAEALATDAATDELRLAGDPDALKLALMAWAALPEGPAKRMAKIRCIAAGGADDPATVKAPSSGSQDDPHSADNRLAAAADLLQSGRTEAGATVLTALLRKVDTPPLRAQLAALTARTLEAETPPAELVAAVVRHLEVFDDVAVALFDALKADPAGAYAVHDPLLRIARDVSHGDAHRVAALRTWLGIWAATSTPPALDTVAHFRQGEALLMPLAAAQLGRHPDPLAALAEFTASHPIAKTAHSDYADAILSTCQAQHTPPRRPAQ